MAKFKVNFSEVFSNRKFGKLTVLSELPMEGVDRYALCLCDCGKKTKVRIHRLRNSHTRSCGCLKKESMEITRKKQIEKTGLLPFGESATNTAYRSCLKNAEKRGLSFLITREDFLALVRKECFYCGEPPCVKKKANSISKDYIVAHGIDRIDNLRGYENDNCVACCRFCNYAKNTFSTSYFFDKIRKICLKHSL